VFTLVMYVVSFPISVIVALWKGGGERAGEIFLFVCFLSAFIWVWIWKELIYRMLRTANYPDSILPFVIVMCVVYYIVF
jgi:hypothetical protein